MFYKKWTIPVLLVITFSIQPLIFSDNSRIYRLDNGLTVIADINRSSPMVCFATIIKVGARNEPEGMRGASHMLEHLIFNGTIKRTQKEIYDEVDMIGAYNNASTGRASTVYIMLAPVEYTEKALDLQTDMLLNSTIPPDKFEKERGIIIEEIGKDKNDPYYMVDNYFDEQLFPDSPYGHPVIGEVEDIKKMDRDRIFAYYKKYYTPSNMTLWISGNFSPENMKILVQKYFKGKATAEKIKTPDFKEPQYNSIIHILKTPEMRINYIVLALPAPGASSPDYPAFILLTRILNSRLEKIFKPNFPIPIMRITTDHINYENGGYLQISMMTPPMGDPAIITGALIAYLKDHALKNIGSGEIQAKSVSYQVEEKIMAEKPHINTFIKGPAIATAGAELISDLENRISRVKVEDVRKVATNYFDEIRFTGVAVSPWSGQTLEETVTIDEQILSKAKSFIPENKFDVKVEAPYVKPMALEPLHDTKIIETALQNGLRVGIIQTPDSPVFAIHLLIKNRSSLEPKGKEGIASLLHRMLLSGTKKMDQLQLSLITDAMGLKITTNDNPMIPFDDIYTSPTFSYIRLETTNSFYIPTLSVLYNIMYHSDFPENELELKKKEQINIINKRKGSTPELAKREFFSRLLGSEHPLAIDPPGSVESISSISRDDIINFRNLYFAPDNIIMTVSTDRPPMEVLGYINEIFSVEKISYLPVEVKAFQSVEAKNKGEYSVPLGKQQSYIYYGYLIDYKPENKPALTIATSLISDHLSFQLREKEGLAYSLGASINFYKHNALFLFTMGTSPENIEKAISGIERELDVMENYSPSGDEVKRICNMYNGRLGMRVLSRINQAYYAGIGIFFYRDVEYLPHLTASIKKLTVKDIKESLEYLLDKREPLLVIVK